MQKYYDPTLNSIVRKSVAFSSRTELAIDLTLQQLRSAPLGTSGSGG